MSAHRPWLLRDSGVIKRALQFLFCNALIVSYYDSCEPMDDRGFPIILCPPPVCSEKATPH